MYVLILIKGMYFEFDVVGYMHTDKPSPSDNGGFVFSVTVSLRESGKRCWGDRGDQTDVSSSTVHSYRTLFSLLVEMLGVQNATTSNVCDHLDSCLTIKPISLDKNKFRNHSYMNRKKPSFSSTSEL